MCIRDSVDGDPARLVARMVPLVRMHAFEARLKRMLKTLDADGMFDPETGLHTRDTFWRELGKAVADAGDDMALSLARFSFDGGLDARSGMDTARLLTRLIRNIDFACRDDDGALLIVFTQTDLRSAHVVARRIAGLIKNIMLINQRLSLIHIYARCELLGARSADQSRLMEFRHHPLRLLPRRQHAFRGLQERQLRRAPGDRSRPLADRLRFPRALSLIHI